jgi:hypothetical protein
MPKETGAQYLYHNTLITIQHYSETKYKVSTYVKLCFGTQSTNVRSYI